MKKKIFQILFLIFLVTPLLTGSEALCKRPDKPAILLEKADKSRKALYRSHKKKKYRHNWMSCINAYGKIYTRYPKSKQAPWAIYHSANLYTGLYRYSGEGKYLDKAVSLYRRVVDGYASHRLADDAQYQIGDIFYKHRKNPSRAYVEFLKVDVKFPSGDMRPKAKKMLDKLAVTLSKRSKKEGKKRKKHGASRSRLVLVKDIRYWSTPNYTRVVIDLDGKVKYDYHLLKPNRKVNKPRRFYLDLKNARVTSEIDLDIPIKDDLLKRARAGQHKKDTVRVVLDMKSVGKYKVFPLYDPFRIVVDVRRYGKPKTGTTHRSVSKKRARGKGIKKTSGPDKTVSLARQLGLNVKRVVIDPGHGGKDPGAIAWKGVKEKNITLRIAKLLARKLRKDLGFEVFLTRDRDVYLSLERRTAIANMKKADLFISLHVNAHKNRNIRGLESYFLNIATDERAVMVAARENATSEKNISDLQFILNDLMLNTKIHESSRLAYQVQKGMVSRMARRYKKIKDLGVKQAPFYVLIGAEMPAVLVEVGFLTNRTEKKRLLTKKYQERVATGISDGIKKYIAALDQAYQGG